MSEHKHALAAGQQVTEQTSPTSWPQFRCHKVVRALKIGHVEGHKIWPADGDLEPIVCAPPMFARGKPVEGDYLVEYEGDGYRSFSPGSIFEAGYNPVTGMDFGEAIRALKAGKRVARAGWNGKGMFLLLVPGSQGLTVDEGRPLAKAGLPVGTKFNYLPHVDMWTAQGDFVPWLASQTDILASDWSIVES